MSSFLGSILNDKGCCHISCKYKCMHKTSVQLRPTYLRACGPYVVTFLGWTLYLSGLCHNLEFKNWHQPNMFLTTFMVFSVTYTICEGPKLENGDLTVSSFLNANKIPFVNISNFSERKKIYIMTFRVAHWDT